MRAVRTATFEEVLRYGGSGARRRGLLPPMLGAAGPTSNGIVGSFTAASGHTGSGFSVPFTSNVSAGSFLVAWWGTQSGAPSGFAISDTQGNTWAVTFNINVGSGACVCLTCPVTHALTTSDSLNLTYTGGIGSPGDANVQILSFSGIDSVRTQTNANSDSRSLTSVLGEMDVCMGVHVGSPIVLSGTGWNFTAAQSDTVVSVAMGYQLGTGGSLSFSQSVSGNFFTGSTGIVALKASALPPPGLVLDQAVQRAALR